MKLEKQLNDTPSIGQIISAAEVQEKGGLKVIYPLQAVLEEAKQAKKEVYVKFNMTILDPFSYHAFRQKMLEQREYSVKAYGSPESAHLNAYAQFTPVRYNKGDIICLKLPIARYFENSTFYVGSEAFEGADRIPVSIMKVTEGAARPNPVSISVANILSVNQLEKLGKELGKDLSAYYYDPAGKIDASEFPLS